MKDEKFAPAALLCSLNYSRADVLVQSLTLLLGVDQAKAMARLAKK